MTKMKRDVVVWAKRIKMSRARLWAVVEGANHDTPFYEGLIADGAGLDAVEFVRAEDIEVDGISAGGKSHSLKIFKVLDDIGGLHQKNKATNVDVVFFVDRDDDAYLGTLVNNEHVHYTHHADVEAEIINHADVPAAISRAFSVSRADAARHAPGNPSLELATKWAEWIAMRLAAADCGWSDTRFAQPSGINVPRYGELDESKSAPICDRVQEHSPGWEAALERARAFVANAADQGESERLVKGKWLAPFVIYLVGQSLATERSVPRIEASHLVTACLMSVDYGTVWADRYAERFGPILNR